MEQVRVITFLAFFENYSYRFVINQSSIPS